MAGLVRIPGPKRQFVDTDSDNPLYAVLGRREADRILERNTFSSNEAKAKANKLANPELAAARPARARYKPFEVKSYPIEPGELSKITRYRAPRYSRARYITMPIELYYGSTPDMLIQAVTAGYVSEFDRIQTAIEKNPSAVSIYVEMLGYSDDGPVRVVVPGLRHEKGFHYQFAELIEASQNANKEGYNNFTDSTIFTSIRFTMGFNNTPEKKPKRKDSLKIKKPKKNSTTKRQTWQEKQVKLERNRSKENEKAKLRMRAKRAKEKKLSKKGKRK